MLNLYTKNYKDFELKDANHNTSKSFSGAKQADKALPNDQVLETETGCKLLKRVEHPTLVGLLELNSKTRYGFTSRNAPIYLFLPFNEAYPPFVVGCSHKDTSVNRLALVKFDSWTETFPRGNLIRLLDSGADEEALSWTYTPLACEKYKGALPPITDHSTRPLITAFHIDPPSCRDVDDVLTFETTDNNIVYITITISDVASQIVQDSPLDLRARQIAQTFYQEGTNPKHVFPPELSEERLSLLSNTTPKPGLSLRFPLNEPTKITWFESLVLTTNSYTYESVYENQAICNILKDMCLALNMPTDDSHKWIEVAMKFYNQESAKLLYSNKAGLLRVHSEPNIEKLNHYIKIDPDLKFLAYQSATYVLASSEQTPYHFGLETQLYTHSTSPIRRYADLVNQRALKAIINNQTIPPTPHPYNLNQVAKQAKKHDCDLVFIRAIKQSNPEVTGKIIELCEISETNQTKISIYVPIWQMLIKLKYKSGSKPNTVISKNEQETYTVIEGQQIILQYYVDMSQRSWKKRMVFKLITNQRPDYVVLT
jgi:exoribonuclease R